MGKKCISLSCSPDGGSPEAKKQKAAAIPDVASMGKLSAGGTRRRAKLVLDDRIHVGLYKYMNNSSLYSDCFGSKPLWVAQMMSGQQPNPLFQLTKQVDLFGLQASHQEGEATTPKSVREIEQGYHALNQFVWSKTDHTDDIGWAKGRVGWYIAEEFVK